MSLSITMLSIREHKVSHRIATLHTVIVVLLVTLWLLCWAPSYWVTLCWMSVFKVASCWCHCAQCNYNDKLYWDYTAIMQEGHDGESHYAKYHYDEGHYDGCHYLKFHYAGVIMLSVFMIRNCTEIVQSLCGVPWWWKPLCWVSLW